MAQEADSIQKILSFGVFPQIPVVGLFQKPCLAGGMKNIRAGDTDGGIRVLPQYYRQGLQQIVKALNGKWVL